MFPIAREFVLPSQGRPASRSAKGAKAGGARRDRTDDLMLAKHALYQLSYGPLIFKEASQLISCRFKTAG